MSVKFYIQDIAEDIDESTFALPNMGITISTGRKDQRDQNHMAYINGRLNNVLLSAET